MRTAGGGSARPQPVERFHATSGRFVGSASLGVIVLLVGYIAATERTGSGLRLAAGLVLFGVLVWVTQLRPGATVYPETLLLRNAVRDVCVPLTAIEGVTMGRMLTVWTEHGRYDCIGIGQPLRKTLGRKSRGPSSLLGWDRLQAYTEDSTPKRADATTMSYPDFIEQRLVSLIQDARRREDPDDDAPEPMPTKHWAWPEIALLGTTALGFLLTLLV